MTRSIGAQIGLLTFGVALIAGLYVGNSPTAVLTRALLAMLLGMVLGQVAGWAVKSVLRDHLQKRKLAIDREHIDALRVMKGEAVVVEEETPVAEAGAGEEAPAPAEAG